MDEKADMVGYGLAKNDAEGITVSGIDGGTPLGFLAALGLLQVLDEAHYSETGDMREGLRPHLSWQQVDAWRPVLHGVASLDDVVQIVFDDVNAWKQSPVLGFRYIKLEKKGPKQVGGLKAPPTVLRAWQCARRDANDEDAMAYASALFCEEVTEPLKNSPTAEDYRSAGIDVDSDAPLDQAVERTFLDYTNRNAQFLEQVEEIRAYLDKEKVRAALEKGFADASAPRTLEWDPAADTPGAIFTGYQRGFLPVHEWLGFRGLRLFPLAARGNRVRMTACTGRRLRGEITWPLWESPATLRAIRSLIGYPRLDQLTPEQRKAFGISLLLSAELTKKADGYTGTFAPARVV